MPKVSFDTAPYVRSHMKPPRGRGSWAFCFGESEAWFTPSVTYGEAKKLARAEAARRRYSGDVDVLP